LRRRRIFDVTQFHERHRVGWGSGSFRFDRWLFLARTRCSLSAKLCTFEHEPGIQESIDQDLHIQWSLALNRPCLNPERWRRRTRQHSPPHSPTNFFSLLMTLFLNKLFGSFIPIIPVPDVPTCYLLEGLLLPPRCFLSFTRASHLLEDKLAMCTCCCFKTKSLSGVQLALFWVRSGVGTPLSLSP
jgi:hypothetical protein